MTRRRKFLSDVIYGIVTWALGLMSGFLVSPILARTLGDYEFGLWSLARRVYSVGIPLALMGLSTSVVRYLPMIRTKDPERARDYAGLGSNLTALSAAVVAVLLIANGRWVSLRIFGDQNLPSLLPIVGLTIWLDAQVLTLNALLRGYGFNKDQSTLTLLARVLNLGGEIALVFLLTPKAKMALWGVAVASFVMLGIQIGWALRRTIPVASVTWEWEAVKDLLTFGVPRIPSGFLLSLIASADTFFVGAMVSVTDAGYFGVAMTLFAVVSGMISPISSVAFPLFSELIGLEADRQVGRYLTSLLSFALFTGTLTTTITAILARPIVVTLYTHQYTAAVMPLTIIMVGAAFYAIYISLRGYVAAHTVSPVLVYFLAVGALVNIGLNSLLIPRWGVVGAAAATSAAYAALGTLTIIYTWHIHPLDWRGLQLGRLPFAIAPVGLAALVLRSLIADLVSLVLVTGGCVALYAAILWALRVDWVLVAKDTITDQLSQL